MGCSMFCNHLCSDVWTFWGVWTYKLDWKREPSAEDYHHYRVLRSPKRLPGGKERNLKNKTSFYLHTFYLLLHQLDFTLRIDMTSLRISSSAQLFLPPRFYSRHYFPVITKTPRAFKLCLPITWIRDDVKSILILQSGKQFSVLEHLLVSGMF